MSHSSIPMAVRRAVLKRANSHASARQVGDCEDCGERRPLDLHHLRRYTVIYPPEADQSIDGHETEADLAALCRDCHYAAHRDPNGDYWWDPEEMDTYWFTYWEELDRDR